MNLICISLEIVFPLLSPSHLRVLFKPCSFLHCIHYSENLSYWQRELKLLQNMKSTRFLLIRAQYTKAETYETLTYIGLHITSGRFCSWLEIQIQVDVRDPKFALVIGEHFRYLFFSWMLKNFHHRMQNLYCISNS